MATVDNMVPPGEDAEPFHEPVDEDRKSVV